jgi:ubiquinone/menaquinone biosynthesis C-methylase UbiE
VVDHRHEALKALLGGNIVHVPRRSPQTVLDLAAGKGAWVVDVAEEFPTADEVVGVDIRRATPLKTPFNCRFEVYLAWVRG